MANQLIQTKDGSHSLLRTDLDETYHSVHGAVTESRYIYIEQGLACVPSSSSIRIFEMGFGTGLNDLCAYRWARDQDQPIHITTIELSPLSMDLIYQLNYPQLIGHESLFRWLHESDWGVVQRYDDWLSIEKHRISLMDFDFNSCQFDCVFYDAFAPKYQPECWTSDVITPVINTLMPHGVFVTYCCTSQLQRLLSTQPVQIQKIPGPPGKREILRAIRLPNTGP